MKFPARGNKEDLDLRTKLGFTDREDDAAFVAAWLGKLVLFGIIQPGATRCPGLSEEECSFLQLHGKKDTWTPGAEGGLSLVETKVVASRFLASGAFIDSERFLPALFASADPNSRISDIGDDILKRAASAVTFEDGDLVLQLYDIYLGTRGDRGSLPARVPLQTKVLALLCKSKLASSFIAQSRQIVEEALMPQDILQQGVIALPKQGLEASKLRGQVFAFTNWLARISSPSNLSAFAPALVGQLRLYIESQGWPRPLAENSALSTGELSSRAYGYESIGIFAGACPDSLLREPNLELLRWLFTSLSEDPTGKEISASIEQALSSVLGAMGGEVDPEVESSLTSLLLHRMDSRPGDSEDTDNHVIRSTRYLAVRFSNRCLPFSNTTARWIDVLAMDGDANERSAILEEGRKGLDPYWYRMLNPLKYSSTLAGSSCEVSQYELPDFAELVETMFGSESLWDVSRTATIEMPNAYIPALTFCRCVLLHQALEAVKSPPVMDTDWERNIDVLIINDEEVRKKLKYYFQEAFDHSKKSGIASKALQTYLQASYRGVTSQILGGAHRAGDFFLELCPVASDTAYTSLTACISSLQSPIFSNNKTLREIASRVFGILSTLRISPRDEVQMMLRLFTEKFEHWRQAIGSEVMQVHGAVLAMAYFLSRSKARLNILSNFQELRESFLKVNIDILKDSRDKTLLEAVCITISELALFKVLGPSELPEPHSARSLLQDLRGKAKDGDEKAINALSHFAMQIPEGSPEDGVFDDIVVLLYELHTVRQAEVQFAAGAALSCAAIGWQSKSLVIYYDIPVDFTGSAFRAKALKSVMDRVLSDCKTTRPALRQASVIWLLCLVQYCGHVEEVQGRLRDCQVAFKGFLADRDTLNQETASRGLTLVYEKGSRALKDDLIRDLVGSFTGTNAGLAGSVSSDTELFDAGALPTGEGSITTYKDIMSLAAEVGDSSLVYRFMSLASNNAIWSSRAAFGRFGLSSILSDASTDGFLAQDPKLYPALFRYRFDPNVNVRNSMNDIWTALVKEPAKAIDTYFDAIMNDLLKNILGKEWRTRQASCAAIADLIQGRPLEKYEKYLTKIWELTFKVCDDIKESVRTAAMALARVLTGILTRGLEAGESSAKSADKMLKQILPFLLSPSGLESSAPDVQDFARKTLLKIIKSSNGRTLRPFVPDLVNRLLALLSSIEPEMINYLHLNADKYGLTAQELDDARLKHIKGSTMLEAIERCLDFLDESSMPELQQSLENAIKTVVGLPSKVGCSRVLVSLSTRQNFIFKRYADHFLPLARKQVFDRNETISSSYAAACGYLARLVSDDVLLKLVDYCRKLYFDSDDDRQRVIAGDIIYAVSKYATDRFNSVANDILPFVFVAKHDTYDRAKTLFEDTWSENVGGSRTVLLYLNEIVDLASRYSDSVRWSVKHTSAFAIADAVTSCGSTIDNTNAKILWPALEKALSGKTWEGKDAVLRALISLAKSSTFWLNEPNVAEQVEKIVLRESKRNNPAFRQHALDCLGDFVELRQTIDLYPQVYDLTKPLIEQSLEDSEEMDVDSQSGGPSSKVIKESTLGSALTALLKSINPEKRNGEHLKSSLTQTIELIKHVRAAAASRNTLNAIYDGQKILFERLSKAYLDTLPETLEGPLGEYVLQVFASGDSVEQVRLKAAEAAIALAPIARRNERLKALSLEKLEEARTQERSLQVQQSLDRARKILDG